MSGAVGLFLVVYTVHMAEISEYGRENEAKAEQLRYELLAILHDVSHLRSALVWRNFNVRKAGHYSRGLAEVELIHDITALRKETDIADFQHIAGLLPPDTNPEIAHAELVAYIKSKINLPVLVHMYTSQLRHNIPNTEE